MKGHIRNRGPGTWAIKVDIGKDPATGKRRTKWTTIHGGKRDAEKELRRLLGEIEKPGGFSEPSKLTVGEYLKSWLADYAVHAVSGKTFERYKEIVDKHLIPALGAEVLIELKPLAVSGYYGKALSEGRRPSKVHPAKDGKRGLSAQTVKHHHRILKQAMERAVVLELIGRNPCAGITPPRPVAREMNVLTQEQTADLIEAVRGTALYIPVLLAATTGMRRGEVAALRWRNVDLDGASLAVVQSLEETKEGLNFKSPKTARSRRQISLPSITVERLRQHKTEQARRRLRMGTGYTDNDLVVCRRDGEPTKPSTITGDFAAFTKAHGMVIRFHDLRHTHITHCLQNNIHPKIVSERAGHSTVALTLDVYSHVVTGMQEEAAGTIDAALRGFMKP